MRYDTNLDPRLRFWGDDVLPDPIVITVCAINEKGSRRFAKDMARAHATGQRVIPIVIDSYGGDAYSVLSMIAQIKQATVPVITIVEGKAMSAGSILFSYGTHRFMAERATLMVHDIGSGVQGKIHEIAADSAEVVRLQESIYVEVARNCGKPDRFFLDELDRRKHSEWYLTAKDAKTHGFIHSIGLPTLATSVSVSDLAIGPDGHELLTDQRQGRNVTSTPRKRRAR